MAETLKDAKPEEVSCFIGGIFTGMAADGLFGGPLVDATVKKSAMAMMKYLLDKMAQLGFIGQITIPATGDFPTCYKL